MLAQSRGLCWCFVSSLWPPAALQELKLAEAVRRRWKHQFSSINGFAATRFARWLEVTSAVRVRMGSIRYGAGRTYESQYDPDKDGGAARPGNIGTGAYVQGARRAPARFAGRRPPLTRLSAANGRHRRVPSISREYRVGRCPTIATGTIGAAAALPADAMHRAATTNLGHGAGLYSSRPAEARSQMRLGGPAPVRSAARRKVDLVARARCERPTSYKRGLGGDPPGLPRTRPERVVSQRPPALYGPGGLGRWRTTGGGGPMSDWATYRWTGCSPNGTRVVGQQPLAAQPVRSANAEKKKEYCRRRWRNTRAPGAGPEQ